MLIHRQAENRNQLKTNGFRPLTPRPEVLSLFRNLSHTCLTVSYTGSRREPLSGARPRKLSGLSTDRGNRRYCSCRGTSASCNENQPSRGNTMKKMIAAVLAGLFAAVTASSVVIASEPKKDEKKS
jgi:hypothetical protein